MLKEELIRAIRGRNFWLACILVAIACYFGLRVQFEGPAHLPGASRFLRNPYTIWLFTEAGPSSILGLLAPLLVTLPFADSFTIDKNSGYLKFILLRTDILGYLKAKFIANAIAGGLALLIPLLASYIILWLFLPHGLPSNVKPGSFPVSGPLSHIFFSAPAAYIMFLIGLAFIFGAVYASFGLGLSSVIDNRYLVLVTPFLLYNVGNLFLAILNLARWTPPTTLAPFMVVGTNWLTVFVPLAGLMLIASYMWFLMSRKEVIA